MRYTLRPAIDRQTLQDLFSAAWGAPKSGYEAVFAHSFTWVAAWANEELVGFVNVAWDGDVHFFLLDTTVHPEYQHRGIGQRIGGGSHRRLPRATASGCTSTPTRPS